MDKNSDNTIPLVSDEAIAKLNALLEKNKPEDDYLSTLDQGNRDKIPKQGQHISKNQGDDSFDPSLAESRNFKILSKYVIARSVSNDWEDARNEWVIDHLESTNDPLGGTCICTKTGLHYLYMIKNMYNKKEIFPIGSSCIKLFGRSDLNQSAKALHDAKAIAEWPLKDVISAVNHHFGFSRAVIKYLFEQDVITRPQYVWLMAAFNSKKPLNDEGKKYVTDLVRNQIRPWYKQQTES